MKAKAVLKNVNVLNMLLAAAVAVFSVYIIFPLFGPVAQFTIPAAWKHPGKETAKPSPYQAPSPSEYAIIAEQNPFHPDRKIPPPKIDAASLPRPEFVLYGTLVTDDTSLAYIEDIRSPYSTPGRGKRQTALKKGDAISGFTLMEIEADRIVMANGEERLIVLLNDPQRAKTREASQRPPATFQQMQNPAPQPDQQRPSVQQPLPPSQAQQQAGMASPSSPDQAEVARRAFENIFKPK